MPLWVPISAAIFGAIVAGGIQAILAEWHRCHERNTILIAIATEVGCICELIRFRGYLDWCGKLLIEMQADPTKILSPTIDIRQNYFPVFESLSPKIGILDKQQVKNIVRFYALCRTAIDSTHADGVMIENDDVELALENVQQLIEILEEALRLGDAIVQFPTS